MGGKWTKRAVLYSLVVVLTPLVILVLVAQWWPKSPEVYVAAGIPSLREGFDWWVKRHGAYVRRAQRGDIDLLFLGDSITENMQNNRDILQKYFPGRKMECFGIGGDCTQHLIGRLQDGELAGIQPQVAVVLIGTNNLSFADTDGEIVEGVQLVVREIRRQCPETKVLLIGILPRGQRSVEPVRLHIKVINAALKDWSESADNAGHVFFEDVAAVFLDKQGNIPEKLMPDALHPSPSGYDAFFGAIHGRIDRLSKK